MTQVPDSRTPSAPPGLVEPFIALADSVGIGVIVSTNGSTDLRGEMVFVSLAACRLLGVGENDLLGQIVDTSRIGNATFANDDWSDPPRHEAHSELRGELSRGDGQRIFVRWSRVKFAASDARFVVHFLSPLEQVGRVEQALFDSERRFRRLIDVAPDGIVVMVGPRIVYANQAITKIHGYSTPRQFSQLTLQQLFYGEDCELLVRALAQSPQTQTLQLRAVRRDGSTTPVEVVLFHTQWDEHPAVLAAVRDLVGRRLLQSQLVHSDRLAAVGTLAAGVAHEINNPLAYVLLNLQYLIREVPKAGGDHARLAHLLERLREARHGAERVVSIVRDLRTLCRTNEEDVGQVDLRRVLLSAINVAKTQLADRGQIIDRFEDARPAFGNAARLEQVFLNLLINAIQALPAAHAESNRIYVRMQEERRGANDYVVVEVTDNGSGIAAENLNRIFDPFFTTKPLGLGTGLGLPICHSIVARLGGDIEVRSAVGQGTTIVVALPVAPANLIEKVYRPSPTPFGIGQRARILVVDDELAVAATLSRVLEEEHDVQSASSAEEALRLMDDVTFDVVFCDLLMPNMTGMDLFAEVARRYPGRERQIAFMTGGAFTPRAAEFLCRVSNPRLEKPFDLHAVRGILRELLSSNVSVGRLAPRHMEPVRHE